MDDSRARELLSSERERVEELLNDLRARRRADRLAMSDQGTRSDVAESIVSDGTDDAIAVSLADRLEAIVRAEQRLAAGNFGRSVVSGLPIPDARLEADPAAERTVDEARDFAS